MAKSLMGINPFSCGRYSNYLMNPTNHVSVEENEGENHYQLREIH